MPRRDNGVNGEDEGGVEVGEAEEGHKMRDRDVRKLRRLRQRRLLQKVSLRMGRKRRAMLLLKRQSNPMVRMLLLPRQTPRGFLLFVVIEVQPEESRRYARDVSDRPLSFLLILSLAKTHGRGAVSAHRRRARKRRQESRCACSC
jgi:hypothetical protein